MGSKRDGLIFADRADVTMTWNTVNRHVRLYLGMTTCINNRWNLPRMAAERSCANFDSRQLIRMSPLQLRLENVIADSQREGATVYIISPLPITHRIHGQGLLLTGGCGGDLYQWCRWREDLKPRTQGNFKHTHKKCTTNEALEGLKAKPDALSFEALAFSMR